MKSAERVSRKEKMKSVKVDLYACLHHQNRLTHSMLVFPTWKCGEFGTARVQNTHLPNGSAGCTEIRPRPRLFSGKTTAAGRAARDAEWTSTSSARRWTSSSRGSARNVDCVRVVNMTFLAARSAGCARTMDTGHRIVQRRVRRIETRGTENRRGEGGWQAFSQLRKREVKIYWHTHNTLTYTDSNTALCNEEMLANPLCVIVEVLNKAICNEEMLANRLCVTAEVLNNAVTDECLRMYKSLVFF